MALSLCERLNARHRRFFITPSGRMSIPGSRSAGPSLQGSEWNAAGIPGDRHGDGEGGGCISNFLLKTEIESGIETFFNRVGK
jgi:hypothetical protein